MHGLCVPQISDTQIFGRWSRPQPLETCHVKQPYISNPHQGYFYIATPSPDGRLEWCTMPIEPTATDIADTPIAAREVPGFIRLEALSHLRSRRGRR